jgi:pyridoxine kinase
MLGREYREGPYTPDYIIGLMKDLCAMGAKKVVLTGVYFEEGKLGAATYDSETTKTSYCFRDVIPGYYHGTGDVFASALVAAVMNGRSLEDSASIAVDYTVGSIMRTYDAKTDVKYGVNFEAGLFDLTKEIRRC